LNTYSRASKNAKGLMKQTNGTFWSRLSLLFVLIQNLLLGYIIIRLKF